MTAEVVQLPTEPGEVLPRLRSANVPRRFEDCRLDTFEAVKGTKTALQAAEALGADEDGRGLVLTGLPGTGKTHLAVGVLAARIRRWLELWPEPTREFSDPDHTGYSTRIAVRPNLGLKFLPVPSFLDRLRAAARYTEADDPLPGLFDADLVVLDDLGREKATDWATERLYVLVNERYNRCLPTVVTSNFGPDELVERGYEALISRLTDGADLIRIDAPDYRRRGR